MISTAKAGRFVGSSKRIEYTFFKDGKVKDIIKVILFADVEGRFYTENLAPKLKGHNDYRTLENVWDFVNSKIKYVVDTPGYEKIKSPGATWKDKFGDCKSHSVFVGSLLHHLGFEFYYRVSFYDPEHPELGHIYCIAKSGGKEIIVDTVNTAFDKEEPFWKKQDYHPKSGKKVSLSGLNQNNGLSFFSWVSLAGISYYLYKKLK